ncbi:MAG: flagellar hook-length control protein FliK, partial [gamma proteobacterium symbiont of Lucinoma myriamae]|nr:flagellar hook-length control protein FliK [gamma proteobacterium symbiont of Lucinoma myriamae]MCU7818135.1 flagellar hook-length control protein FliK [gamma proteobacterium symbiont of Lucinoma myriamae]MCU7831213.1 flagellar hook-length control protein FliK [gamma proteobacterium symbiont of Lucinoma myriamae]
KWLDTIYIAVILLQGTYTPLVYAHDGRTQLEGVLSRIIITQLHTREGGDQSFINFEVPFRHNDQLEVLQLKIREKLQEKEALEGNKIWTVNMAFHLKTLGGIRIYITLDKQELAMQFWTEEKASQRLLQHYFPLLSERLVEAGFSISQLSAFHGIPEDAENEQSKSQFIIDERV